MGDAPGYWMNETSGVLRPAVVAYLKNDVMTDEYCAAMRSYLRQWMASPHWEGDSIAMLRSQIDDLKSRDAISEWLSDAMEIGIDPL